MSQAKVDQYKKDKANRKKIVKRERVNRMCARIIGYAIVLAIVAWAGVSGYQYYESVKPAKTYVADITAIDEYLDSLNEEAE